jgi:O-antigen/teichoic acid export membrane protein
MNSPEPVPLSTPPAPAITAEPHRVLRQTARGGVVSFAGQIGKVFINLLATVCLARLLTPAQYGLFGMATVITGFAGMFADLGLNQAALQREQISKEQLSGLFWVNQLVGAGFALAGVALAPLAAWFYGEPQVAKLVAALSLVFCISAVGSQHLVVLRRELRFSRIVAIDIGSLVGGVSAAIACASALGVWSLVVQQLVTPTLAALGYWQASRWRPMWLRRLPDIRSMLQFGAQVTGFRLVNYLARNVDNVLIGAVHGAHVLGLYARAYSLFVLPLSNINQPLSSAVIPGMSRAQLEPAVFRELYLGSLRAVAWMSIPVSSLLIALADPLIPFLLGGKWLEVVPIFRLLGICGFGQAISNTMGWVYIARGDGRRMLRWGIFASTAVIVSFFVGVPFGAKGVALAYSITTCLLVPIGIRLALKGTSIGERETYRVLAKPVLLSALVAAAAFGVCHVLGRGLLGLAAGLGLYALAALAVLRNPEAKRVLNSLRERLARGSAKSGG